MIRQFVLSVVAAACTCGFAFAAEPITLELKNFKLKAAFETTEDLVGYDEGESRLFFYTNGTGTCEVKVPEDGEYTIAIDMGCTKAEKDFAQIKLSVGDTVVKDKFDLTAEEQKEYTFTVKLKKGDTKLAIAFLNDKFKEGEYDLNLFVYKVTLTKK